jgi:DNA polymerase III psi subunit
MKLGKLRRVDLRDSWRHEALDFTQWLAEPENLQELGDEIGINIQLIKTEMGTGRYSVDIVAREETTDKKIVIENQLETTDHSHLGQLLTYAAGLEAEFIIWIVKEAREEHKQAVDWLNEHSDEKINIFLIKIELWQIGDSEPAPKFNVLTKPNNWTKIIRSPENDLTKTRLAKLEFWQQFRDYAANRTPPLILNEPGPHYWYNVPLGRSDCNIGLTIHSIEQKLGCELYIPDSKQLYQNLYSQKVEIENELGLSGLSWQELPEKKASRIRILLEFDFENKNRNTGFDWLYHTALLFKKVFQKRY